MTDTSSGQPASATATHSTGVLSVDLLTTAVRDSLCGPANLGKSVVVWTDAGSEILLAVGKVQVRTDKSEVVVAVETQSVEFGVAPLIVRFVFGDPGGPASLVAASDAEALGHPQVAARWGTLFRDVVWAAIARLVDVQASSKGRQPGAIAVTEEGLHLTLQPAQSVADLAVEHVQSLIANGSRLAGQIGTGRR